MNKAQFLAFCGKDPESNQWSEFYEYQQGDLVYFRDKEAWYFCQIPNQGVVPPEDNRIWEQIDFSPFG